MSNLAAGELYAAAWCMVVQKNYTSEMIRSSAEFNPLRHFSPAHVWQVLICDWGNRVARYDSEAQYKLPSCDHSRRFEL